MNTFASDFIAEFDARWKEVSVLIEMAEEIGQEEHRFNILCRAAIVLIVANFEGFLQEAIKCLIKDVNDNDAFSYTSTQMKRTFCSQFIDPEDKRNEKKVTRMVELFEEVNIHYTIEPFLYENNKNPKASVIEKYFKEIGGKDFFSYITNCDIEKVFENDLDFVSELINKMKKTLEEGTQTFPYNIDISTIGFNLAKEKASRECLWKVFLNQTLRARHDVAHGILLDNTITLDELKNTKDKIAILELTFAVLIFTVGLGRSI